MEVAYKLFLDGFLFPDDFGAFGFAFGDEKRNPRRHLRVFPWEPLARRQEGARSTPPELCAGM